MTKDPCVYLAHIQEREAAKRIPAEYRVQHPNIPWQLMAGFRDILIHAYVPGDLRLPCSAVRSC